MKEEAAGLRQAPRLSRPPSPQLRTGAGGTGGSQPELGGCAGCGPHPQLCLFSSRTERILPWMGWTGPMAAARLGSCHPGHAEGSVDPSERARLTPGHLPGFLRGSLILPRGQGAWLGRAGRGMSPRRRAAAFCREPPLVSSGLPDPRSARRLSCSCGPTMGPAGPARPTLVGRAGGFWGGCWSVTCGRERPLCCALDPRRRGGQRRGRGPPAPSGAVPWGPGRKGEGVGTERTERVCSGSGAAPRGGCAVPTCAPGQAPAGRRADGSPVWRIPPPAPLFPLTCPKSAWQPQRSPPAPNLRGAARGPSAPPEGSAPGGRVAPE